MYCCCIQSLKKHRHLVPIIHSFLIIVMYVTRKPVISFVTIKTLYMMHSFKLSRYSMHLCTTFATNKYIVYVQRRQYSFRWSNDDRCRCSFPRKRYLTGKDWFGQFSGRPVSINRSTALLLLELVVALRPATDGSTLKRR